MKFFLKCGETAEVCDKCQYDEATAWDNFRMKVHLLICKYCRHYSTKNHKLTESIRTADIKSISKNKKKLLKAKLNQEINTTPKA